MAKEGGYTIEDIYQGGYSALKPSYGDVFTGYRVAASSLGANTKPDTANQIQSVNQLLNQGIVPVELTPLSAEVFNQVPKQHFKEIKRMSKLTGAKASLHAPVVEPAGLTQQGWSESERLAAERQLIEVVERAVDLDDRERVPVNVHASAVQGSEYKIENGKKVAERLIAINQDTGRMAPLEGREKFYPVKRKVKEGARILPGGMIHPEDIEHVAATEVTKYTAEKELEILNDSEWDNTLSNVIFYKEGADRIISENMPLIAPLLKGLSEGKYGVEDLEGPQLEAYGHLKNAETYLDNTQQHISGIFDKAYQYSKTEEEKEILRKAAAKYAKDLNNAGPGNILGQSQALQGLITTLKEKVQPELYVPLEKFAAEKAGQTFGNVAYEAYKKYGDKAPLINIENLPYGMAFATGDDMNLMLSKSKESFVKKSIKDGISESEAKRRADEMLGMTLDVGHLNIAKKRGFTDKDLMKEVEQIAKHVKHVHLTDNFGFSDSHLPPGMGNVPIKKIMQELEEKGFKGRSIVEAGGWVQHFGTSPLPHTLEGMGSAMFAGYPGVQQPYWNQAMGLYQGYFGGYGEMLPRINYQTFGAGFSQLPSELGGQVGGGGQSRMSGTPME